MLRIIIASVTLFLAGSSLAQVRVVVSIQPYGALVRQIAGELAEVEVILPAGASPHTFEPTPRMATRLADAQLIVLNGGLDEWLRDMAGAVGSEALLVEALDVLGDRDELQGAGPDADGTQEAEVDAAGHEGEPGAAGGASEGDHDHGDVNPHVWLDPVLMIPVARSIGSALEALDPENAKLYGERTAALERELEELHATLLERLEPFAGAPFVPFHDAWPYFAARYGLDLVMEIEPFPGREPSPRYLAQAIRRIRESGAPVIFTEVGLSDRPARILAAEAGVEVALLDPLGGPDESYGELMLRNATAIAAGLAGWRQR